jgi:hypothetical protein
MGIGLMICPYLGVANLRRAMLDLFDEVFGAR